MVSGTGKILRVAWICHFSNQAIQERLGVRRPIHEFAPWITIGIEEAKSAMTYSCMLYRRIFG